MRIVFRLVSLLAIFCVPVLAQDAIPAAPPDATQPAHAAPATGSAPAAASKMPAEAAKVPNPVKPTATSLAAGKKQYGYDCAMCHGKDGDGKGDLAADMKLKLLDYSDPAALKGMTDGELFYIIKNGKGDMPSEGDRVKPEEVWNLVNYVRSFSKNSAGKLKTVTPKQ
ncbi:MAG TPA: c-type cytochrome [Candidatus Acidoferrales bacterium]